MAVGSVQAARSLHQALLHNIMHSPQSFFDTTPSGRILNRFSKDIYVIDEVLASSILMLLGCFYNSIAILVIIVANTPLFMVVILPLAFFYLFVQVHSQWVGMAIGGRLRYSCGQGFCVCKWGGGRQEEEDVGSQLLSLSETHFPHLKIDSWDLPHKIK